MNSSKHSQKLVMIQSSIQTDPETHPERRGGGRKEAKECRKERRGNSPAMEGWKEKRKKNMIKKDGGGGGG